MKDVKEIIRDKFVGEVIDDVEYNVNGKGEIIFKFEDGSNLTLTPTSNPDKPATITADISYIAHITGDI